MQQNSEYSDQISSFKQQITTTMQTAIKLLSNGQPQTQPQPQPCPQPQSSSLRGAAAPHPSSPTLIPHPSSLPTAPLRRGARRRPAQQAPTQRRPGRAGAGDPCNLDRTSR